MSALPWHDLGSVGGDLSALAALVGVIYVMLNVAALARRPRDRSLADPNMPVSVLVPLCGAEYGLYERLARLCRQSYGGPVQIVCGVASASDPALGVARAIARDFPTLRIEVEIDARLHGPNRKVSKLVYMAKLAAHDTLVMLDSDILVGPHYLRRVVGELARPGVGAVTCLYVGLSGGGPWAAVSAMNINVDFLPNVISALRLKMGQPCFGATIALSRACLERIGGLAAFADTLFDDYAIGMAVRQAGLRVVVSEEAVGHVCLERTSRDLIDSQLRRARTIRAIDPVGNAGSVITHPFALACVAALLGNAEGLPLVLAAAAARLVQCLCVEWRFDLPRHRYLALPLRDLMAFGLYVAALAGRGVIWRGQRFRVAGDGDLSAARSGERF